MLSGCRGSGLGLKGIKGFGLGFRVLRVWFLMKGLEPSMNFRKKQHVGSSAES